MSHTPTSPGLATKVVQSLIEMGLYTYFRFIEVVGAENIPQEGAVLFCGNHTNSLIDPMLIMSRSGRFVRFAAADVVFENPVLRFFLTRLQAVPVRRRQDHGGETVDNTEAFDALYGVLAEGGAMGIFPEGKSHRESDLAQFRTGPARLAMGAKNSNPDQSVFIVPCGFHYTNPNRFRSSVLLRFGSPIEVTPQVLAAWHTDQRGEVRRLTDELEAAVRGLMVTGENWEIIRMVDTARRLYQPQGISLADRVELARRFNEAYPKVADDPEVMAFLQEVEDYTNLLDALHLKDKEVRDFGSIWMRIGASLRLVLAIGVLTPLALLCAPIHLPLLLFIRWGGRRFAPRYDVVSSTKFIAGLLLTLFLYGVATATAFWMEGPRAAMATSLVLPVCGAAFIAFVRRIGRLLKLARMTLAALIMGRGLFDRLQAKRTELVAGVDALVSRLLPEEMERMFPPMDERDDPTAS